MRLPVESKSYRTHGKTQMNLVESKDEESLMQSRKLSAVSVWCSGSSRHINESADRVAEQTESRGNYHDSEG